MLDVPDPFALKRNVARSLNSQMVFEYIQERFRMAYKYFACPQSRNRANASRGLLRKKSRRHGRARSHGRDDSLERKSREERSGEEDADSSEDEEERDIEEEERLRAGFTELLVSDGGMNAGCKATAVSPSVLNGLPMDSDDEEEEEDKDQEVEEQDSIAPEDIHYIFDRMIFTGGKVISRDTVIFVVLDRANLWKNGSIREFWKLCFPGLEMSESLE